MYVFINPIKPQAPKGTPNEITYEFAQKEIAQAKGFKYDSGAALTKGRSGCMQPFESLQRWVNCLNVLQERRRQPEWIFFKFFFKVYIELSKVDHNAMLCDAWRKREGGDREREGERERITQYSFADLQI